MLLPILALALALGQQEPKSDSPLSNWVRLESRPTDEDLYCAMVRPDEWTISRDGNALKIASTAPRNVSRGLRISVDDGWLVGDDIGEFGGGLSWTSFDGARSEEIHPSDGSLANPSDPFKAENVVGLEVFQGSVIVFMGLDHLGGRSGRLFRAVHYPAKWVLEPVAILDGEPLAWIMEGDRILVVTRRGLWAIDTAQHAEMVMTLNFGHLHPNSMVRAADGSMYFGLRHYLMRLARTDGHWIETWFAPSACSRVRLREQRCDCIQ